MIGKIIIFILFLFMFPTCYVIIVNSIYDIVVTVISDVKSRAWVQRLSKKYRQLIEHWKKFY